MLLPLMRSCLSWTDPPAEVRRCAFMRFGKMALEGGFQDGYYENLAHCCLCPQFYLPWMKDLTGGSRTPADGYDLISDVFFPNIGVNRDKSVKTVTMKQMG